MLPKKTRAKFYHGSGRKLKIGTILGGRTMVSEFPGVEPAMEFLRPSYMTSRLNGVYMVQDIDNLNFVGAPEDYIYEVEPMGVVHAHNFKWMSEVIGTLFDHDITSTMTSNAWKEYMHEISDDINAYWSGAHHPEKYSIRSYEWIAPKAKVLREV